MMIRDIQGMEDLYWQVIQAKQNLEILKKQYESENVYDLLYSATELYTENRKRMQIDLIREFIFELKRKFNKEFEGLKDIKEEKVYNIDERNKQIMELLEQLKQQEELYQPPQHTHEDPEHIFKIKPDEIKVEKYLTKKERAVVEAEKKKQEEKERLLQGDNVG